VSIAKFNKPEDMAADNLGNVYVADYLNHRIRKIDKLGNVTTIAGPVIAGAFIGFADGIGNAARFHSPQGICWDLDGDLLIADAGNHAIRKITITGSVTTVAGDGSAGFLDGTVEAAKFHGPHDVKVDKNGNIYIVDSSNSKIRKITSDGEVSTLANVNSPNMLTVDRNGIVYVSDSGKHLIYKITQNGSVSPIAGTVGAGFIDNCPALQAKFNFPKSIEINPYEDLPIGLTLNPSTGIISGTPESHGFYSLTYRVTDSCGNTAISNCTLTIDPITAEPEFDFQLPWQFTDSGALAFGHDGSGRSYTSDAIPPGGLWAVSDNNLTSQVTWENSLNCGGSNPNLQTATATINIKTLIPQKIGLLWDGVGELQASNFDMMQVYINGILIGSAHAAGGGQGCADGPVVSTENFPDGFDLPAGDHTIFINATTNDGLFHTNSFYKFKFTLIQ
jgi:hypothetical protein